MKTDAAPTAQQSALDLKPRAFTETGWGRYPTAAIHADLPLGAFAALVFLNYLADADPDATPDVASLAKGLNVPNGIVKASLEVLTSRKMLLITDRGWTLTDPKSWG